MRHPRRDAFVDEAAFAEPVDAEFGGQRPNAPFATSSAIAQPEPGIALNPPVPQPQLTKMPSTGVFEMIGERSPVMSTIPPHQRSIFSRLMIGKVSTRARTVSSTWWNCPRWV
jgi:hypothetical protein